MEALLRFVEGQGLGSGPIGARGVLVRGLALRDIDRLNFYEGGFDYELKRMRLHLTDGTAAEAGVYFPPTGSGVPRPGAPWASALGQPQPAPVAPVRMADAGAADEAAASGSTPAQAGSEPCTPCGTPTPPTCCWIGCPWR